MKPSNVLIMICGTLLFLMLGGFLFFMVFLGLSSVEDVYKDLERLYAHRFTAGIFGILFLSCGYGAIKFLLKRTYRDEIFVVDSVYGRTSISVAAIEDLLRKTLRKYDTIKSYRLKMRFQNKVLAVTVNMVIWAGQTVSEVIIDIQNELTKKLTKVIGLSNESLSVNVKVIKVLEQKLTSTE